MSSAPQKRGPGAGDIIDVVQLTPELLKTILDAMGNVERKIAVGIGNETSVDWNAIGVQARSQGG